MRLGANPVAREKSWQDVIAVTDLMKGDATPVNLGTRDLAVFDTDTGITVSMARCTHGAANLCDGYFDGKNIECPLHQGLFDASTGAALAAPARVGLRMLQSRVHNGQVQVLI